MDDLKKKYFVKYQRINKIEMKKSNIFASI